MTVIQYNLLNEPHIRILPFGATTLPGLLAALARDEVEGFPALRPHQVPCWHMFLVQLATLALHGAGETNIPENEANWSRLLRHLTRDFPDDEPWCLLVKDWTKPAFMQPPVPVGSELKSAVPSPDALDLLITSKNHDLKKAVAHDGVVEDWVYALISLQTGEGFGGAGNQGIARMNGGSSSRSMLSLAPLPAAMGRSGLPPRAGAWFRRDVRVLLAKRDDLLEHSSLDYRTDHGLGLVWLAPWPEGTQIQIGELDIWFIEVCRRVRLTSEDGRICARRGTSRETRIQAKHLKGALGDPYAPVHKTENKSFTLSGGDFDYRTITELFLSGDWVRPLLAEPASFESNGETLALVASALARGNSKTEGFKSRMIPVGGKISRALGPKRAELHRLAREQMETIGGFDKVLRDSLVLVAANGDRNKIKKEHYNFTSTARDHLDRYADTIFFERLWARFEAQELGEKALHDEEEYFSRLLWERTRTIFDDSLPSMPCAALFRHRAEARARHKLHFAVRMLQPGLFPHAITPDTDKENANDASK
ncbi:MAG: CRISPR-associated protein Cse1 [Magnetococcales bacterium]|nr:CRISPR-associated protein Cse1 [Magnetococcales bacterium]